MIKKNILTPILFTLLILSVYLNYKLIRLNNNYREQIPHVIKGERISEVDLLDKNGQSVDRSKLENQTAIIYVFRKDCSPCDKNIFLWNKIAKFFKDKIPVFGIVPNTPTEAFNFEEKAKLNFDIFVPDDLKRYVREMKLRENRSQTIVYKNGRMHFIKVGELAGKDAKEIINKLKGLI
jgi:peroxiredoxin